MGAVSYYDGPVTRPRWRSAGAWRALAWSLGVVALLWVIEFLDVASGSRLEQEGIRPGDSDGLTGVLVAPLLHDDYAHLSANTGPLLVLGFLLALAGLAKWFQVTIVVALVAGVGTWLFGGAYTNHIGASGIVFGWLVYLVVRGLVTRRPGQIVVGVVIFIVYGSILWGVLPTQPGVSWQSHLFGAIGGGLAAWWLEERAPRRRRNHLTGY